MPAGLIEHIVSQCEQLPRVQIVGFRLPAVPDHRVDPSPGGAEQRHHPVIIPIIHMTQHNGRIFRLYHAGFLLSPFSSSFRQG